MLDRFGVRGVLFECCTRSEHWQGKGLITPRHRTLNRQQCLNRKQDRKEVPQQETNMAISIVKGIAAATEPLPPRSRNHLLPRNPKDPFVLNLKRGLQPHSHTRDKSHFHIYGKKKGTLCLPCTPPRDTGSFSSSPSDLTSPPPPWTKKKGLARCNARAGHNPP